MYTKTEKPKENKRRAVANSVTQEKDDEQGLGFLDNRPEAVAQRKLHRGLTLKQGFGVSVHRPCANTHIKKIEGVCGERIIQAMRGDRVLNNWGFVLDQLRINSFYIDWDSKIGIKVVDGASELEFLGEKQFYVNINRTLFNGVSGEDAPEQLKQIVMHEYGHSNADITDLEKNFKGVQSELYADLYALVVRVKNNPVLLENIDDTVKRLPQQGRPKDLNGKGVENYPTVKELSDIATQMLNDIKDVYLEENNFENWFRDNWDKYKILVQRKSL